jgi:hypothetical protein
MSSADRERNVEHRTRIDADDTGEAARRAWGAEEIEEIWVARRQP